MLITLKGLFGMKRITLFLLTLLLTVNAGAVTLEEALISGYDNNEELRIVRTDFLNEIEQFPRALAAFLPKIYANAQSSNNMQKKKSGNSLSARNSELNSYSRNVTLEQPIFEGFSSVAGLKAAQSSFRASRADFYAKEQEVFLKEISAYLDCVEAKEKYEISAISVRSNKKQLEAAQEKFKLGEATATEVASAREGVATSEANQAHSQAQYEATKANFIRIFGIEATNLQMPEIPKGLPASLEELIKIATEVNPAIDGARHKIIASRADEQSKKGELLPKVSFRIQGGDNIYNPEQGGNTDQRSVTSSLSVNVPIYSKGGIEYSDIRRAKNQSRKAIIGLDAAIKQMQYSSQATWSEFEASNFRIDATTQAVTAAEIAYEGSMQEEMLGSKTIIDVLRTEERLNKAKESRIEARKAMVLSAYRMKALTGNLTAKAMNLKVNYFEPEAEFKKIKMKVIGF